jgi:hypothetical protein
MKHPAMWHADTPTKRAIATSYVKKKSIVIFIS